MNKEESSKTQESAAQPKMTPLEAEKQELRAKFPTLPEGIRFCKNLKRVAKGQTFFDSADYEMARQKKGGLSNIPPSKAFQTGEATLEEVTTPPGHCSTCQDPNN